MNLIIGKEYYILHIGIKFKGKYETFFLNEHCYYSFIDVEMKTISDSKFGDPKYSIIEYSHYLFTDADTFYDMQQMRYNKIKAIQCMEQRSLDMVLKRLVNENFQW